MYIFLDESGDLGFDARWYNLFKEQIAWEEIADF